MAARTAFGAAALVAAAFLGPPGRGKVKRAPVEFVLSFCGRKLYGKGNEIIAEIG
jgi:hypothetical protein